MNVFLRFLQTRCASSIGAALLLGVCAAPASAVVSHDQDATPDILFGSGNVNGSFSVDRANNVELALRGKLRFNESNAPENTFNSNSDGTFSFAAGVAPGGFGFQPIPPNDPTTPVWSFEWSINTNYDGGGTWNLDDLTYTLEMDFDSSGATDNLSFDPIHDVNPGNGEVLWDHGIGTNATPNGGGATAGSAAGYATLLSANNVAQNSWSYEFFNEAPFDDFDPTQPGTYDITLTAFDGATPVASVTVQIVVEIDTDLVMSTPEDWCNGIDVGQVVTVDINLENADHIVAGGEFLIAYNADVLTLNSVAAGDPPFNDVFINMPNPLGDTDGVGTDHVFFAVGDPFGGGTTIADTLMATLSFTVDAEFCSEAGLVEFVEGTQPLGTYLTNDGGSVVPHNPVNLDEQTVDDTPPVITCPPNVTVLADAGGCDADVDIYSTETETFDVNPTLSASMAPGVWYTDRYAPFGFVSEFFDGDNRLKHSIDASDCSPCRGGSFNSGFYDTQGRKYDTPGATRISIEVFIPAGWATTERRMAGFWGTAFDAGASVSYYPIIEFTSTTDGSGVPRFRYYSSELGDWIDMGLPTGFAYDEWYTLDIELDGGQFIATVGDLVLVDNQTFGSVEIGNVILQGHNNTAGVTYDIYWDNLAYGYGPSVDENCEVASVTGVRSDLLPLTDPYPSGITTITWTATDGCGHTDVCMQQIEVLSDNELVVDLAYDGNLDNIAERCIEFVLSGVDSATVTQVVEFNLAGEANGVSVLVPCGDYDCVTVRDPLHTLASSVAMSVVGTQYTASATDPDDLLTGNLNGDPYIDILDFGVFVGQYGSTLPIDTGCSTPAPHSDITGDGLVGLGDFSSIQTNFLEISDTGCTALVWNGASPVSTSDQVNDGPVRRISLKQLERRGLSHMKMADLTKDGWLDEHDIIAFMQGARP